MATYYVDAATGSDSDTGLTEALAWATIDKAMNTVAAGDTAHVKGGTDYTETATIDTYANSLNWISFIGYTTTPGDGGQFTIDATGLTSGVVAASSAFACYSFENMIIENATSHGFSAANADAIVFRNCEFNDNGGYGLYADNYVACYGCIASGNSNWGFRIDGGQFIDCIAKDNTGYGFRIAAYFATMLYRCLAVGNTAAGIVLVNSGSVINCTIDGENDTNHVGILLTKAATIYKTHVITNNIIVGCYRGISGDGTQDTGSIGSYNLLYDNDTDYYSFSTNCQGTDLSVDPDFVDEANRDYTLSPNSPAIAAGLGGVDIGAYQRAHPGLVITG